MAQAPHLIAGEDAVDGQADLARDVAGHEVVVAGHDLEGHAVPRQLRDGLADPGLGRVAEEDHALEDQVVLHVVGVDQSRRCPRHSRSQLVRCEHARADGDEATLIEKVDLESNANADKEMPPNNGKAKNTN